MDWNFNISDKKIADLRARIERLGIDLSLVEEQFTRGGGKGGQKINKTNSCVRMSYPPLELTVRFQKSRDRNQNRFLALRELVDQIEMIVSPETSQRLREIERLKRRKATSKRKARKKHTGKGDEPSDE